MVCLVLQTSIDCTFPRLQMVLASFYVLWYPIDKGQEVSYMVFFRGHQWCKFVSPCVSHFIFVLAKVS